MVPFFFWPCRKTRFSSSFEIVSDGIEDNQMGWSHFSVVNNVRGCNEKPFEYCVKMWVETSKTQTDSISVAWTLADKNETSFLGKQELTVSNEVHPTQAESLAAFSITYELNSTDRSFDVSQNITPGVKYTIELK